MRMPRGGPFLRQKLGKVLSELSPNGGPKASFTAARTLIDVRQVAIAVVAFVLVGGLDGDPGRRTFERER
jgi:hypothetical protein